MGQCGCCETIPYKILRVGKNILVVEIYKGCEYCNTGLVVTLHIMTPAEAKRWEWEAVETFEPDKFGYTLMDFPLVGVEDLVEAAKEIDPDFMGEDGCSLSEWLEEYGLELLQRATRRRLDEVSRNQTV